MKGRALLAGAVILLLSSSPAWAGQENGREDFDFVVLTGRADVALGDAYDHLVIFDGPAVVEGTVRESVVAFNGEVTVSGHVGGDIVSFNGVVRLEDGARVEGDVVSRLGADVDPGARVDGEVHEDFAEYFRDFSPIVGRLLSWLAVSVSILALGYLLLLFAPRGMEAISAGWRASIGGTIGWGFLVFLGLPLLGVLALITLVGIPFGVGLLLSLGFLYSVGYTVTVWIVGRQIMKPPRSRFVALLVGWAIMRAIALVPILGGIVWFLAAVFGLGATIIAIWRARATSPVEA